MKYIRFFSNYCKLLLLGYDYSSIDTAFKKILKHRAGTLIKLDKYDTGEIKKSKDLAQLSSVRDYLREVQKLSV